MPPFFQFRMWVREGPPTERILASLAAVVALVLVAFGLAPVDQSDGNADAALATGPAAATSTPGAEGTASPNADTVAPPAGETPAGTTGAPGDATSPAPAAPTGDGASAAGPSAASACSGRAASGPGITAEEVRVAVSTISLAGPIGNSTFDIRPDLPDIARAYTAEINRTGGVACGRKLVIKVYEVNPLDAQDSQAKCLQMVQDNPYLVIDFGGYLREAARACFPRAKLPIISSLAVGGAEARATHPYVLSPRNLAEQQGRNGILGLRDRGFFAPPKFQKVGLFLDSCIPDVGKEIEASLAEAGIKPNQISKFVLECAVSAPPNQVAQAVLQHKADNATHVFLASSGTNGQSYARLAASQSFRPAYGVSDYGENATAAGSQNWHASFEGAVAITSQHIGEVNSGIRSPEFRACDEAAKRNGVPGHTSEQKDTALVAFCDLFKWFRLAIDKAGVNPTRATFVEGISRIGTFKTANVGDGVFDRPGKIFGGDFQRAIRYHGDCKCWKVVDGFKPGYRR